MPAAPKKATTAKKTPVKKTSVKKTPVKKAVTKAKSASTHTKKSTNAALRSFRPSPSTEPFFTFKATRQTAYWLVLSVIVVALAAWVLQLSAQVQSMYDQIEENSMNIEEILPAKKATTPETK